MMVDDDLGINIRYFNIAFPMMYIFLNMYQNSEFVIQLPTHVKSHFKRKSDKQRSVSNKDITAHPLATAITTLHYYP